MEQLCVGMLKLFLGLNRQGSFLQEGCGSVACGVQMSSYVPVIWCLLVRKGSKFGTDKWVEGNLSAFKGLGNCCAVACA